MARLRRHRRHSEPLGERGQATCSASDRVTPEWPLQLDPKAIRAEGPQQPLGQVGSAGRDRPRSQVPATARRARIQRQTSPSVCRSSYVDRERGGSGCLIPCALAGAAVAVVISRQRLAPAPRVLDQQRDVHRARQPPRHLHGQLAADDRPHPDALAGVGELHRPADVVVVGQRPASVSKAAAVAASSAGSEAPSRS